MSDKVKAFKENVTITGVDFHVSFYERMMLVLNYFASPDALATLKEEAPDEYYYHLETLLILFNTLDEKAEEQNLVMEHELKTP